MSGFRKPQNLDSLVIPAPVPPVSLPVPAQKSPNVRRSFVLPALQADEEDLSRVNPDEMFKRFTVGEVKALQLRLRAEADAKQEELRLMVGESYRELLQASSAIVSISHASQRVMNALEEIKDTCNTSSEIEKLQRGSNMKKRSQSISGALILGRGGKPNAQDSQLVTLQILAAHLKLLLDTPEQLWRLLERKRHLHAAWLFLLARVVYRALVRTGGEDQPEEDDNDIDWVREGIHVTQQFPLAQRQWDAISQFRSQISHKASQSLREIPTFPTSTKISSSTSDSPLSLSTAETLLAIVLLDSLPVPDALSLFLSQRTKALQALYTKIQTASTFSNTSVGHSPPSPGIFKSRRKNREMAANLLRTPNTSPRQSMLAPLKSPNADFRLPPTEVSEEKETKRKRDKAVKDVWQSLRQVLEVISLTTSTVRDVFGGSPDQKALMDDLLEHMQLDHAANELPNRNSLLLPPTSGQDASPTSRRYLTTKQILSSLPSSALLLRYLPPSIQTYAPYVDTISPSSRLSMELVRAASKHWFKTSISGLEEKLTTWLGMLGSIREIWSVWLGVRQMSLRLSADPPSRLLWISRLTADERTSVLDLVQDVCTKRAKELWKDKLLDIEGAVTKDVQRCIELVKEDNAAAKGDINPSSFLFSSEYLTASISSTSRTEGVAEAAVKRYQKALQQRVAIKTPLLNSLLVELEQLAKDLKEDILALAGPEESTKDTAETLMTEYAPLAETSLLEIASSLREVLTRETSGTKFSLGQVNAANFIGKVTLNLAHMSSFAEDVAISRVSETCQRFRDELDQTHQLSIDYWSRYSVSQALEACTEMAESPTNSVTSASPSGPSAALMQALLSLVSSLQSLGLPASQQASDESLGVKLLKRFCEELASKLLRQQLTEGEQLLWDLSFLTALSPASENALEPIIKGLLEKLSSSSLPESTPQSVKQIRASTVAHVTKLQILLGPLAPLPTIQPPSTARNRATHAASGGDQAENKLMPMDVAKPAARFGMLMVQGTV